MEKKRRIDSNLDRRIIERKIRRGEMTYEELNAYLKDLPDLSDYAEETFIPMERKKEKPAEEGDAH
ncbi:MAG: hypothetical protein JW736_02730 [Deltaproteobacteria bacterium]|nr:hypothetical protein [Deltaproteobacteria bacterium]MBN2688747.1 hypothetical protein [Deltaproteobacteria bacterium]